MLPEYFFTISACSMLIFVQQFHATARKLRWNDIHCRWNTISSHRWEFCNNLKGSMDQDWMNQPHNMSPDFERNQEWWILYSCPSSLKLDNIEFRMAIGRLTVGQRNLVVLSAFSKPKWLAPDKNACGRPFTLQISKWA